MEEAPLARTPKAGRRGAEPSCRSRVAREPEQKSPLLRELLSVPTAQSSPPGWDGGMQAGVRRGIYKD